MQTKNIFLKRAEKISIFLMTVFFSVVSFAQESTPDLKVDVNSTKTTTTDWFSNPVYWIIGAVVLIIIIALITRGNNNANN